MGDHPDWERYGIRPPNAFQKVGDPTRWGVQLDTTIPAAGLQNSTQILQAQTRDAYSRSWSLIGTLALHPDLWGAAAGVEVSLEVVMGVGQAQISQRIALFYGTGFPGALCEGQYLPNGGPYQAIPLTIGSTTVLSRPFAAIGAIVGQAINIRARYNIAGVFPALPAPSNLAIMLTPYAAGEGL